jgi:hypothetical protein
LSALRQLAVKKKFPHFTCSRLVPPTDVLFTVCFPA